MILQYLGVLIIGIIIGFLGGLFGKGGSAIATPMLSLIGIPGFISVTSPLPATIPGTFIASVEYWKSDLIDWQIVWWSIIVGFPSTVIGAFFTSYTGAIPLLILTGLLVLAFGLSFVFAPRENKSDSVSVLTNGSPLRFWRIRLTLVALFVGLISGLLANSGGFLLAPGYSRILHLPLKKAFACSLFVSMFLAIPGTVVHAYLGHINWLITGVLAVGSVPFSFLGAKTAINTKSSILERWYGIILTVLGIFFLIKLFY